MTQPTVHVLESSAASVSPGVIDPSRPALTIDSGDVVSYPNTWTQWGNQARFGMSFADREPLRWVSAPCRLSLRIPNVHYFRFDEDRAHADFVDGIRIPLAGSMGVLAVEPEGEKPVSAILAGPYGGNLDLAEITEGTSLFLPVFKSGARVWSGDANAAQSDGVVDQTGIESAMEELRGHRRLDAPSGMTLTPADSLAILQLVARADACATERDADGYAALFTDDAVMDGDMGTVRGQRALRETVTRGWAGEPAGTLHLTLNAVIDESGKEPAVDSVMLMVGAGPSPTVLGSARVRQTVRHTPDGWRISARWIDTHG